MPRDIPLLFVTRVIRMFGYGFLSVVLALYLAQRGLSEGEIGLLFTLTLAGDAAITLWLTTSADRAGRKKMLIIGALLMIMAGVIFSLTGNFIFLVVTAIIGVISPSGNEIGPFLSIEQAALSQLVPDARRTQVFAWYNLAGSFATATGALIGGFLAQLLQKNGYTPLNSYRAVVFGYTLVGLLLVMLFLFVSSAVEAPRSQETITLQRRFGLHKSRRVVFKLSSLFALDAFAGGLVVQSMVAYWFNVKFGVQPAVLGTIFFAANILAGISALSAAWIARRIGLINTMVFTHIPSNILLILVPFMPTLPLAITALLLRFSISQMDVPTRQSYTVAVVSPDERSAAMGVTSISRSVGASLSPAITGQFLAIPGLLGAPFVIAGSLKIIYDVLIWRGFRAVKPPEER
ncbi:MAG: MFS transporter [Anaerolineales bacterium]|nr:MFS transporter [Anaerolineae bacterium]PWB53491.1 MAG: MFS transporter [Anaerolineales bacterium]